MIVVASIDGCSVLLSKSTMAISSLHSVGVPRAMTLLAHGSSVMVRLMSSIGEAFTISLRVSLLMAGSMVVTSGLQSVRAYRRCPALSRRAGSMNTASNLSLLSLMKSRQSALTTVIGRSMRLALYSSALDICGSSSTAVTADALRAIYMASMPSPAVRSAVLLPGVTNEAWKAASLSPVHCSPDIDFGKKKCGHRSSVSASFFPNLRRHSICVMASLMSKSVMSALWYFSLKTLGSAPELASTQCHSCSFTTN